MLRSGNVGLSRTRASGTNAILASKGIAIVPSVLLSRYQHPGALSRRYASMRTEGDDKFKENKQETTKWGARDRYRTIGDRGRWQRKRSREMRLAKEEDVMEKYGEEGEEREYPKKKPAKRLSEAEYEKEMQYIQRDRVALAQRVKQLLKLGHEEKATLLVRAAEKAKIDCIVSWNALMEHKMKIGRRKEAMSLFNDMKKRGRFPNEQTFTTLLSGLAAGSSKNSSQAAIKLFESMKNANSESKPNIIHRNAVLNVCARNGDMKSLWEFAGEIPEHGENSPNSVTYTTILNAIRTSVLEFTDTLDPDQGARPAREIFRRKRIAVLTGKKLWSEVIRRWRTGDVVLDSKLVTSMARLLAIEDAEISYFDIFLLYQQCMGLPVPAVKLPDIERLKAERKGTPESDESLSMEEKKEKEAERKMLEHLFDPVDLEEIRAALKEKPGAKKNPKVAFPLPTNAELTFIIEICQNLATNGMLTGSHYWKTITSSEEGCLNVKPDSGSCHEYLRFLRRHRASAASLKLIQNQMAPENLVVGKTLVIALSTCSRDRNNPNALQIASELLDMSDSNMAKGGDLIVRYIDIVRATITSERLTSHSKTINRMREGTNKMDENSKVALTVPAELHQSRLLKAITHLKPFLRDAMELLAFGYIKYNKKPAVAAVNTTTPGKEGEPAHTPVTAAAAAEEDALAEKAVSRIESGTHTGPIKMAKGPNPDDLLHILWQSHALYKRILGPQLIPSSSDSSPNSSSISLFLADSDRDWLSKDCERLSLFTPYFKQFELRAKAENDDVGKPAGRPRRRF
ncbi:hypothetical protein FQN49_000152 [Arthroderma sp. PD_2]|nr:hypothetical protein FQN49_000152 [Arthroderma sp. PD_2]